MPKTIAFLPLDAYGPTNSCVGIGDVRRRRGPQQEFLARNPGTERAAGVIEACASR